MTKDVESCFHLFVIVQVKGHNKCVITPLSPSSLTAEGGRVGSNTKNVEIECSCIDDDGVALNNMIWFSPDEVQIKDSSMTTPGDPYFRTNRKVTILVLVIPNFVDAHNGSYTCTTGIVGDVNATIGLICKAIIHIAKFYCYVH